MSVDARDLDGCNDATRVGLNALNRARRATRDARGVENAIVSLARKKKKTSTRHTRTRARRRAMLDVNMLRPDKGGDPVRAMRASRARVAEDAGGRRRRRDRAMGDGARAKLDAKRARGGADGR